MFTVGYNNAGNHYTNGTVTITTQCDDGGATIEADNIRTYGFIFKQASSSASNDAPNVQVFEVSAEL